jgi:hypothetical protein
MVIGNYDKSSPTILSVLVLSSAVTTNENAVKCFDMRGRKLRAVPMLEIT